MRCVALLRAVNVGSANQIAMKPLCARLAEHGFGPVTSHLRSGNLTVSADGGASAHEAEIERLIRDGFGLDVAVMLRTAAEWRGLIGANPFRREAAADPAKMQLGVLKSAVSREAFETLREGYAGPERLELGDRALFMVYPDGMGRSKLTTRRIETALGTEITVRNWNTVEKLRQMTEAG
ncbi:DUF1697 domain-containing protein [Breoghania sp. L-A4]|uniref:DUF1697 domain-containing protein n=1 Tax=Breoghania sp. L-A4 TaxID=2304600 RepID=UPI000E35ADC0|nr:DUF1697 domain-containing protein [Breoghania sp. L-A4]AXS40702.1 DUF1697 domain-containing protein [Breoghania sp. L-A4]